MGFLVVLIVTIAAALALRLLRAGKDRQDEGRDGANPLGAAP